MKNIIYILNLLLLITLFNSCGTSSSTQEGESSITSTNETIEVINCDGTGSGMNDCINYTCIKPNDTLVSNTNNTLLEIIHTSANDKKVCVKLTNPAGSAKILR